MPDPRPPRAVFVAAVALLTLAAAPLSAAPQVHDSAALAGFLPDVAGWSMGSPETLDQTVGGTSVSQAIADYTGGGATVRVSFLASPSMVAAARGMSMMFRNEQMVTMMNQNATADGRDKTYGLLGREGWTGWTVIDGDEDASEATGMTEALVVKVEIDRADAELLAAFLDAIPWAGLAGQD